MKQMLIRAQKNIFHAVLEDNAAAEQFYSRLPFSLFMMNLYGNQMCCRIGEGKLDASSAFRSAAHKGEICCWPPAGAVLIFYKDEEKSFLHQPIGRIREDVSTLTDMHDTVISFEKETEE